MTSAAPDVLLRDMRLDPDGDVLVCEHIKKTHPAPGGFLFVEVFS